MREIIFRGKRTDNGEWVKGYYSAELYSNTHYISAWYYGSYAELQKFEVDPETIGQFTGLTDVNGTRIFEGDIVKTHYGNAVKADFVEQVVFFNGIFCTMYKPNAAACGWYSIIGGPRPISPTTVYMDRVEVIGNLHDNPELLNEENTEND